ncbi:hypothetical protein K1T71_004337 [Dendrolimus kikuchii]|uniref:Uncharacterized protein n=1 Tax=Dendrolimus kikuchii TaxID=765133 RepID=A0ACC1D710_9NEOP|nr:hypothetical protein K1T71_004337 [Dendrolimus kikuchii]
MEIFDKLFSIKRKLDSDNHGPRNRDRLHQINPEQVRLLLFKEYDWRGRKLLFDSSSIQKVPAGNNDKPNIRHTDEAPCIVEVSDGFSYVYKGPAADANVLGEMIFGAVAMNYKSVSLKIHIMDEPRSMNPEMQIKIWMKVFCTQIRESILRRVRKAQRADVQLKSKLISIRVELKRKKVLDLNVTNVTNVDIKHRRYYGEHSPHSSIGSTYDYFSMLDSWDGNSSKEEFYSFHSPLGRKLSTSSNGSWQRRTFQNMMTRFDLGNSSSNLLSIPTTVSSGTCSDSQLYSNSSTSGTSDSIASTGSAMAQRKSKLGLALLITVTDASEIDMVRRCLEHSPQLQALVCRLRLATLTAGASGGFVSTLYRAAEDAARWLSDLIYGPRLQPLWLNLVTSDARGSNKIAESLLSDLCSVLAVGDTKNTNFFISTLLTHVLTYHLGWVTTVSPYDTVDHQKTPKESSSNSRRPYNALWAQLNDLCGTIGFPLRTARTIISGTSKTQFVNRLLVVLTYFVRCGDVKRRDFQYQNVVLKENSVISVDRSQTVVSDTSAGNSLGGGLRRTTTQATRLDCEFAESLKVPSNTQNSDSSVSTLAASDVSIKRSSTLANLSQKLSNSTEFGVKDVSTTNDKPMTSQLRRNPTFIMPLKASSISSLNSSVSEESESEPKVVFVLGDNEKLVGLKNKSADGKSVKKSSKIYNEPIKVEITDKPEGCTKECEQVKSTDSPSKCCGQTLQHSKPIKHSGFKFEFDKYPQIVTNYMKSKNLEILDRHYIGKPGNLKLDNFQFDPTIVPPIQEERCETCVKCQLMESMLQTPTNASEMEYMNDMPRMTEPQYAKETVVGSELDENRELTPKTFVRRRKENTVVVNLIKTKQSDLVCDRAMPGASNDLSSSQKPDTKRVKREKENKLMEVKQVIDFPLPQLCGSCRPTYSRSGFDGSLLGGITDHYVPDLVLQGTVAKPNTWEADLRRDLDLTSFLNKSLESPLQSVAIIGDTNTWEVRVVGRECGGGGMSSLVGAMLDALPLMWRAKVPANQCLSFLEGKLREFCILSKTLADMLMTTDFIDIATLTKSLHIDVNDVPLLLAVATTHTPQVVTRYGISYSTTGP